MSDTQIVWEDPPETPNPRNGGKWLKRLAPLTERPGSWARVAEFGTPSVATNTVSHLKNGRLRRPPGRWEFTGRTVYVYARYLGPEPNGDGA